MIYNSACDITALSGNRVLDTTTAIFASLDEIDPGEQAQDTAAFRDLEGGFESLDKLRFTCDWLDGNDRRRDISSGSVTVSSIGYTTSFSGIPAVTLLITNNSSQTLSRGSCGIEAKRDDLILDVASVFYTDLRPGEAAEETGTWFELSSFDEFDSEPFDLANLNCTYSFNR